ncbi:MAG: dockerin type I domain-containing protein [Planctomycetota bacterium]
MPSRRRLLRSSPANIKLNRKSAARKHRRRLATLQSLEQRYLLAGDLDGGDIAPEPFTFEIASDGEANQIRLLVEDDTLVVRDELEDIVLESIPLECVSEILILGSEDADELIVDLSGGPFGVPIDYRGGAPAVSPGDALTLVGGEVDLIEKDFLSEVSGSVTITDDGVVQVVRYDELEPVSLAITATDIIFGMANATETIRLEDGIAGDGRMVIDSSIGEIVDFSLPTGSLVINAGGGDDLLEVLSFDSTADFTFEFNGGTGDDTVQLTQLPSTVPAVLNGEEGADRFEIGGNSVSLDELQGLLTVNGGTQTGAAISSASVTAITESVTTDVDLGDELVLNDSSSLVGGDFTIDATSISRVGSGVISSIGIESTTLTTTNASDTVTVNATANATELLVFTGDGEDFVDVLGVGDDAILAVDTGLANDTITIDATAQGSVVRAITRAGSDVVAVTSWSGASGLDVITGTESDVVTVSELGTGAVTAVRTEAAEDVINVRSTAAGSFLDVMAGSANDTVNIASDANGTLVTPGGSLNGDLNGIEGQIRLRGNSNDAAPTVSTSVTVKASTRTVTTEVGDTLNLIDTDETNAQVYALSANLLTRGGSSITHSTFESFVLQTGSGGDSVSIESGAETTTSVDTGDGDDTVDIVTTGADSALTIDTGLGLDTVDLQSTGDSNVIQINTGEDDDDVWVQTLSVSAALIETGAGSDVVAVQNVGTQSELSVQTQADDDVFNFRASEALSTTEWIGGDGNDTAVVSSDANATRTSATVSAAGDLDSVLGQLCLDGASHETAPQVMNELIVKSGTVSTTLSTGDRLLVGNRGSASRTYDLRANRLDLDTNAVIEFSGMESVDLETGNGSNVVNVVATLADTLTNIETGSGDDQVTIATTGMGSVLDVDTSTGNDVVSIENTGVMSLTRVLTRAGDDDVEIQLSGASSAVSVNAGTEADLFNLFGSGLQGLVEWVGAGGEDIANVRATGPQSITDLRGGTQNDTVNVSSTANGNRTTPSAGLNGSLNDIGGELCVHGNENEAVPEVSASVTALGESVTTMIPLGDTLNISDRSSGAAREYTIDASMFERIGSPLLRYLAIESLTLETGNEADRVLIEDTLRRTQLELNTNGGLDAIEIRTTGDESILHVDSGTDADTVTVVGTGNDSVARLVTRAGDDDVLVEMTGERSGLMVNGGTESDLFTLVASGPESVIDLGGASGEDIINVRSTGLMSATEVNSGTGNDTINVSSNANGSRMTPSANASGNLESIQGSLLIHGSGDSVPPVITDSVTADGTPFNIQTDRGDELNLSDRNFAGGADYSLSENQFVKVGGPTIAFQNIELLRIQTGDGNDTIDVSNTRLRTRTEIDSFDGEDTLGIGNTGEASVLVIDAGLANDSVQVSQTGESSLVRLITRAGDDDVQVISTGLKSGLDVNTGSDVDLVTIEGTGEETVSRVVLGDNADILNVQAIESSNAFEAIGSNGSDAINVSSDATAVRGNPTPTLLGDLSGLQSNIRVLGNINEVSPPIVETLNLMGSIVEVMTEPGDFLNIGDRANVTDTNYTLTTTRLVRSGLPEIEFHTVETVQVIAGSGDDTFTVGNTRQQTRALIETGDGSDTVQVNGTGDNSFSQILTGIDADTLTIRNTGDGSLVRSETNEGEDNVTIQMTGDQSGLTVNAGTESDLITLGGSGDESLIDLFSAAGDDIINVQAAGLMSITSVDAGTDNDTLNVSSQANGSRGTPSASASGTLDLLQGTLLIDGGANSVLPVIADSVTADGTTFDIETDRGDELNFSDRGFASGADYSLFVNRFERVGGPTIDFQSIESLGIETGEGDDSIDVRDTGPRTRTEINSFDGEDTFILNDTGNESVLVIDSGLANDSVVVSQVGESSLLRLITRSGDDDVQVVSTGLNSALDVNTGSEVDLVTVEGTINGTVTLVGLGDAADILNVQSIETNNAFEAIGSGGSDAINVSSDAAAVRGNPIPTLLGDLSGLESRMLIRGNANETTPPVTETLDVKGSMVEVMTEPGDFLNISDHANAAGTNYTLTTTRLVRTGLPEIEFQTIETIQVTAGSGNDTFTIGNTRQQTRTLIDTGEGADSVRVTNSGDNSLVQIQTGAGTDELIVRNTGEASLVRADTADADDDVTIEQMGIGSGLELMTGDGADLVTMLNNGIQSIASIDTEAGDDVLNIQRLASQSSVDVTLGAGNDTANVTSTADGSRTDSTGDLSGDLAGIEGALCVSGGDDPGGTLVNADASARETDGQFSTVSASVDVGDRLNVSDRGNGVQDDYELSPDSLTRTSRPAGTITFDTIEAIDLRTTPLDDSLQVIGTPDQSSTVIDLGDGDDTVTLQSTGAGSITSIATGSGQENVAIEGTGTASLLDINTGDDADVVSIASIGDDSGINVATESGEDTLQLLPELSPTDRPIGSVISLDAGADADVFEIDEVFLNTVVDARGGADDDRFDLTADGADAAGYLGRLNNDPGAGSDDSIAASRQLLIDGGSNGAATVDVAQGASLSADPLPQPVEPAPTTVSAGDQINIDASSSGVPLDLRYVITGTSEGVLATTSPNDPRAVTGNEVFESNGIEEVNLTSGSGDDLITISSLIAIEATATGQRVGVDGGDGTDKLEVLGTDDHDLISVGPLGDANREAIETANLEFLRIDSGAGDDQVVNRTNLTSVIDTLDGDDIVLGGTGQDLLTGGDGVDSLFGREGNDVLFTDQVLGSNAVTVDDGEIIDGGVEDSIPPGDTCVQFGLDSIRNCEIVGDGGGIKDVLTWLRGVFIDPRDVTFTPLSPVLDPFVPAFPAPAETLLVTEPSKLPMAAGLFSAPRASGKDNGTAPSRDEKSQSAQATESWVSLAVERFGADPMDVNRDGRITPADALYVINLLGRGGQSEDASDSDTRRRMLSGVPDANRDNLVTARDALVVINRLARASQAESEGITANWAGGVDQIFSESLDEDDDWWVESDLF